MSQDEALAWAREHFPLLSVPGMSMTAPLPRGAPNFRRVYVVLTNAAHRMLGPGCYSVRTEPGGVQFTREDRKP